MIFRLFLSYLILTGLVFGALWVLFRTSWFNTGRVVEFLKRAVLAISALTISGLLLAAFVFFEKLT